jgi:hypothetical protein
MLNCKVSENSESRSNTNRTGIHVEAQSPSQLMESKYLLHATSWLQTPQLTVCFKGTLHFCQDLTLISLVHRRKRCCVWLDNLQSRCVVLPNIDLRLRRPAGSQLVGLRWDPHWAARTTSRLVVIRVCKFSIAVGKLTIH